MDSSLFTVVLSMPQGGEWVDIPMYSHNEKKYIVGPKGKRFQLWIVLLVPNFVEFVVSIDGLGQSTFRPASLEDRGTIHIPHIDNNHGWYNFGEYNVGPLVQIPFHFWERGEIISSMRGPSSFEYVSPMFGIIGVALYFLKPKDGITLSPGLSYQDRLDFFERTTEDPVEVQVIRYEKNIENLRSLGIDVPVPQPSRGLLERENLEAFPLSKVSQEV